VSLAELSGNPVPTPVDAKKLPPWVGDTVRPSSL
jgi:hypothetical protein